MRSQSTDEVYAVGKTLAYTSIRFLNSKDELVARGSHTKCAATDCRLASIADMQQVYRISMERSQQRR